MAKRVGFSLLHTRSMGDAAKVPFLILFVLPQSGQLLSSWMPRGGGERGGGGALRTVFKRGFYTPTSTVKLAKNPGELTLPSAANTSGPHTV